MSEIDLFVYEMQFYYKYKIKVRDLIFNWYLYFSSVLFIYQIVIFYLVCKDIIYNNDCFFI